MGIFGNMLTYQTGQFRDFTYFNMVPKHNSGYIFDPNVQVKNLRGVLQNSASRIADSNGNLVDINDERLWCETQLQRGFFINFANYKEVTYRIVDGNDWPFEGGFFMYTLERVVGDNGTPDDGVYTTGIGGTPV